MSIRPHTQQHQIETGQLVFAQTKKLSHRTLVLVRGGRCIGVFAVNAEDLVLTQEQVRKQSFASHAIVAVGVIGANMPRGVEPPDNATENDPLLSIEAAAALTNSAAAASKSDVASGTTRSSPR